jgi:hypothetical protein
MANIDNEFDAAKIIVTTLKDLERTQQERALRFASESLGLNSSWSNPSSGAAQSVRSTSSLDLASATSPQGRVVDIKQFTDSKAPKSDQQFAAVVAYYYQFEAPEPQRKATINASVLSDAARLANRRRPSRHALANAKRSGYLDAVGSGEYKVNTVGENLVAITLPSNVSENSARPKRKTTKKASRAKSPATKQKRK